MWLLNTSRGELRFFVSPQQVPSPGYAILSHVWGEDEQTFQDVQAISARYTLTEEAPREHLSFKVRNLCILAEKHGYA